MDKDNVINWRLVNSVIKQALQSCVEYIPIENFINDNATIEVPKYPYVVLRPAQHYVRDEFTHYQTDETFDHVLGVTTVDPDNDTSLQIADTIGTLIRDPKYLLQLKKYGIYVVDVNSAQETGVHLRQFDTNYQYYFEITFRIKRNGNITRNTIDTLNIQNGIDSSETDMDISQNDEGE